MAFELCALYSADQSIREREVFENMDHEVIKRIDSINFARLIAFIEENGYPNEKLLGKRLEAHECVGSSAFALLLHNPHKLIAHEKYFNLLLKEVEQGNLKRETLAFFLDKYYWSRSGGKKVMYGSDFGIPCVETKEETNRLRAGIGLEKLTKKDFKKCE